MMNDLEIKHSLRVEPYPYQVEGIRRGLEWKRLFIGDEPGLGKTLQSVGVVNAAGAWPLLVICPSSLKINWQREIEKFTGVRALVLDNATRSSFPYLLRMGMYQAAVVNYESLRKYFVWDIHTEGSREFRLRDVVFSDAVSLFRSVIIDECHRVKDPQAQQTIFTKGIATGKEYVIMLSGTPVVNKAEDLVAQLSIMDRLKEFGGRARFMADFDGDGADLSALSRLLYERCMIRRQKAKVLTQLPAKTRTDLFVEIANREEYDLAAADLAAYLRLYAGCDDREVRRKMRMEALVRFMTLRSLAAKGKVKQAVDFIRTFLGAGNPLIVFCSLHEIVDELTKAFPDAVTVTGRDTMTDKQAAVDDFQSGRARLIICSIKAAGVGLTLTASSNVAFIELPWTYADCCQCEDRAHRIGQKDNVTCYYLLGRGTIDSVLYAIIHRKKTVASQIMASDDDIPNDSKYFDELVTQFLAESREQEPGLSPLSTEGAPQGAAGDTQSQEIQTL
jgi:SWI/SNF-related matrix-associated actin-dependent regulator 1 of chromatin subfamily A